MRQRAHRHPAIGRGVGLAIAASVLVAGTLAVHMLLDLRRGPSRTTNEEGPRMVTIRHRSAPELGPLPDLGVSAESLPPSLPPWEATPENTPLESVLEGHIPAWQVKPPPPDDPVTPIPDMVPSRDPAYRPPMHNPGGVDGDRPPRPLPQ